MKSQISIKKNLIQYKNRLSQNPFSKIFKQNIILLIKKHQLSTTNKNESKNISNSSTKHLSQSNESAYIAEID